MLDRLLVLRSALYSVLHDRKVTKASDCEIFEITNNQWKIIEELVPALRPLADSTEALSSEAYPSASCILPMLHYLRTVVLVEGENDSPIVTQFKAKVLQGINKRFLPFEHPDFPNSTLGLCTFLDPRHKRLLGLNDEQKGAVHRRVIELISDDAEPTADIKREGPVQKKRKAAFTCLDGDIAFLSKDEVSAEQELDLYLTEPVFMGPFDWWKHYSQRFPRLSKLAKNLLCIMGTSIPSERAFLIAGLTLTNKRNQMSEELLDEVVFLNKTLKQKQKFEKMKQQDLAVEVKKEPLEVGEKINEESIEMQPQLPSLY